MKAKIVCPKCNFVFDRPRMDLKITGLGWTFPGLGVIKCPNCGYKAPRDEFSVAES